MATFVQLGEEDTGYDLALVLNSIISPTEQKEVTPVDTENEGDDQEDFELKEAKESDFGKLVTAGKHEQLLNEGFIVNLDKIMKVDDAGLIDTCFSLAFSVLHLLDEKQSGAFITTLCSRLTDSATKDTTTHLKLNLLCVMFNLLDPAHALRKEVFMVLLNFAKSTGNGAGCVGQLKLIPNWIAAWKLKDTEEAALYLLVSELCEQAKEFIQSQSYLVKYLVCISNCNDDKAKEAAKPHAAKAAVAAIKSFSESPMEFPQYDCDRIRKIPIVSSLEKDQNFSSTYQLLKIFACDEVSKYLEMVQKFPNLCQELGLDHDMNLQKLRTLTICSLGMAHEHLSYETLIEKLQVTDKDAVESVIIDAVMAGRVDAKIDQEAGVVIIQRTTQRIFNKEDWKTIGTKLDSWKTNIHTVLATLHNAHAQMINSEAGYEGEQ